MRYLYLGGFPPPYGGVTVKNKLLYSYLANNISIAQSRFYNKNNNLLFRIITLIVELISKKNSFILGVSKTSLRKLTYVLYFINRKAMKSSIVIVMGGTFPKMVIDDKKLKKYLVEYKHIYVETEGMKKDLNSVGISNVSVFPNCRERAELSNVELKADKKLRCLFFSLISKEKGSDNVLKAAEILNKKGIDYTIDFYGEISPNYQIDFKNELIKFENVNYKGIFKSTNKNDVYLKLQEYDVLLFPTKWKNEGVPGVLVEAKIAGVPSIVSNVNFNSEIIENEKSGIVLKQNTPLELVEAIERLYLDRNLLIEMKANASLSSESYIIENYIDDIILKLEE